MYDREVIQNSNSCTISKLNLFPYIKQGNLLLQSLGKEPTDMDIYVGF